MNDLLGSLLKLCFLLALRSLGDELARGGLGIFEVMEQNNEEPLSLACDSDNPMKEFEVETLNELLNSDVDRFGIPQEQQIHVILVLQMGLYTASGMFMQLAWNHS